MKLSKICSATLLIFLISSCALDQMARKYDTVKFTTTPEILETHGGKVNLKLNTEFEENYFAKKATVEFTPVLVYEGGEKAFKSITVQGEDATGGEATIFKATGGNFNYNDAIDYNDNMYNSRLELRATAKIKDKEKTLGPVDISQGVIATSTRVQDNEILGNLNHGYQHISFDEEIATIYFLVNQSNIRTTEKSDEDIKALKKFAKKGYKTHSIEIISYASPEGSVNINDNVSENRMNSTVNYTKRLLRSLKVDGANNKELYNITSVGEDWDGFENLIDNSNLKDKNVINRIVNSIEDVNEREQQIRDLAEIYEAVENDILPQLRKATIKIKSFEPKRTDEEIATLSTTKPEELDIKELLFAATLTDDINVKKDIYNNAVTLHNDWRGYNNIACLYISDGNDEKALEFLSKAEKIGGKTSDILTNRGILAARNGELNKAQKLFDKAKTSEHNQAILDIRQGEYNKAARFYKGKTSYNAHLSRLLNGDSSYGNINNQGCEGNYLNAVMMNRKGNDDLALINLDKLISSCPEYKEQAANDLEFLNLRSNEKFIEMTK